MWAEGFDAKSQQITAVADGTLYTDGINLDQMNLAISGLADGTVFPMSHSVLTNLSADDHTQYLHKDPGDDSRNQMIMNDNAVIPLKIEGFSGGHTVDLQRWSADNEAPGDTIAFIDSGCKMTAVGFDASGQQVNVVADGTVMQDAATINQLHTAASGTLQYWEQHLVQGVIANASGTAFSHPDASITQSQGVPIARRCQITTFATNALHIHGSDPGDWDVQIFRRNDDEVNPIATFIVEWDSASFGEKMTTGVPVAYSGVQIWELGDMYSVAASGVGIANGHSLKLVLGFESRENFNLL